PPEGHQPPPEQPVDAVGGAQHLDDPDGDDGQRPEPQGLPVEPAEVLEEQEQADGEQQAAEERLRRQAPPVGRHRAPPFTSGRHSSQTPTATKASATRTSPRSTGYSCAESRKSTLAPAHAAACSHARRRLRWATSARPAGMIIRAGDQRMRSCQWTMPWRYSMRTTPPAIINRPVEMAS